MNQSSQVGAEPKLLICDQSRLQCELLANAIQALLPGVHIVSAQSMEEAEAKLASHAGAVVMLSGQSANPTADSFRAIRRMYTRFPSNPIIYVAECCSSEVVVEAFRAGAKGVAYKDESFSTLVECIEHVRRQEIWAGNRELKYLIEALQSAITLQTKNALGDNLLTAREQQVTQLVAEGMSNREISLSLNISEHTVKNYMFHIFDKLGISNRVELVRYAQSRSARAA